MIRDPLAFQIVVSSYTHPPNIWSNNDTRYYYGYSRTSTTTTTLSKLSATNTSGPFPSSSDPVKKSVQSLSKSNDIVPSSLSLQVRCVEETRLHLSTSLFVWLWIISAHDSVRRRQPAPKSQPHPAVIWVTGRQGCWKNCTEFPLDQFICKLRG